MLFSSILNVLPTALLLSGARGSPVNELTKKPRQASLDSFISSQADISLKGITANIGPNGAKASGVPAGIVLASPSRQNPNCE